MNIAEHFTWHRKRIPSAPPRIHTRGVYVDERGHGSGLGSPAFAPEFRRYLENPFAQQIERYDGEACSHPTLSQKRVDQLRATSQLPARDECAACEGTGRRSGERHQFEWALRAAMERVQGMSPWHQKGPSHHTILTQLVQAEFNVGRVQAVLVPVWSCVSGGIHVIKHVHRAEHALRRVYSEVEIPLMLRPARERTGKSENQSSAEAAA